MPKYSYDRHFRLKILSLMLDNFWMAKYGGHIIRPEYFETDDEEQIARAILEYREKYHRSPKDPEDLVVLAGDDCEDLVYELYDDNEYDTDLASDLVVQFAKEQAIRLAILDSVDDINRGRLDEIIPAIKDALAVGDNVMSPGIDLVEDADKWIYSYWDEVVPTGWYHLDLDLEGGLKVPELGVILGPPNRGKSMALVNIGYSAASILSGKNVVHFTHEMSVAQTAKRYAARMTFKFLKRDDDPVRYHDDVVEIARRFMPGRIRIIGGAYKMKTTDIENHLDRLQGEGFEIGLIIDDYLDLVLPPRKYSERRFELSATYEWARGLSDKYGVPMWSATQGRRSSLSKELITMEDIAEDIGKAAIADVIVAVCQTREEEEIERCRLYLAKVRDGRKNRTYLAKFYGSQQAIVTTGVAKRKKVDEHEQ